MNIAPDILKNFPDLNDSQKEVIGTTEGPLLVIAGPGSGKTYTLVLRALNILLLDKAAPREILLSTFTEKAALELRDRFSSAAQKVGYAKDLSDLNVGTIHGFCSRVISENIHRTELGNNFETLDELTQLLFMFEHFPEIVGAPENGLFLDRWSTKWTTIKGLQPFLDKITEELVDLAQLEASGDGFARRIAVAYRAYEGLLISNNRVDFAHLQKLAYEVIADPVLGKATCDRLKYVLVDEYQDTNYIQEQLLLRLTESHGNLCVVGDEDQSLYRFRGATVRNILEFPEKVRGCKSVPLSINYRSHRDIITRYDRWMASANWANRSGRAFRFGKQILPDPKGDFPTYPAVLSVWGASEADEANRVARLVEFLKSNNVIQDYSQVALLLHSVRTDRSGPYIAALEQRNIRSFCPRARAYFENQEVQDLVACLALIFGWYDNGRGEVGNSLKALADYVDQSFVSLAKRFSGVTPLTMQIQRWSRQILALKEGESLDLRPADYLYKLLALPPFTQYAKEANAARNLAVFSQLLNSFQTYYHYTIVSHRNREVLRLHLFNSFLRLLYQNGLNEYEDPDMPFPKGYVQIMTIHQAKGLEFPVVIVGSLAKNISSQKQVEQTLAPYYHRPQFEPEDRITEFDRMRLHYVAFSRPQRLLVLTTHVAPKAHFAPIWDGLPQWPHVEAELLAAQKFQSRDRMVVKKSFSFTGDLKLYETCPRQYQFFKHYGFTPSRSAVIFFGLLVHQTIEGIHRVAMDGSMATLNETSIRQIFDKTYGFLVLTDKRAIGDASKEAAFRQVMSYFTQNQDEISRVIQTEVDVSLEKSDYILIGKVDLLMGRDGKLEVLDFKTSQRSEDPALLATYEDQLCTYAHILERRHGRRPERLVLYWTAEPTKARAVMEIPYHPEKVEAAGRRFDDVVVKIKADQYKVVTTPERKVCEECDIRSMCVSEGLVSVRTE